MGNCNSSKKKSIKIEKSRNNKINNDIIEDNNLYQKKFDFQNPNVYNFKNEGNQKYNIESTNEKTEIKTETREKIDSKDKMDSKGKIEINENDETKNEYIFEDNNFSFNDKILKENNLYFIKKEEKTNYNEKYSTENDYYKIIKSYNGDKLLTTYLLLKLNERNWIKESIEISEMIKNRDENFQINKFLSQIIKLYNDFNWLIESLSTYFFYSFFKKKENKFPINFLQDTNLPSVDSNDWFNGFEWKGLFIRVQKSQQSKKLFNEMKALNYLFFDYIQIIDNYKINIDNLLLNEIILPILSYNEICGMILFATPIIYYLNMDDSFYNKEVFNLSENNDLKIKHNFENFSFQDLESSEIFSNISSENLLKINHPKYDKYTKFLIYNITKCIPSLFSFTSFKKYNFFSYISNKRKYYNYLLNQNYSREKLYPQDILKDNFSFSYNKKTTYIIEKYYDGVYFKIFYNIKDSNENYQQNPFIDMLLNNDIFINENKDSTNQLNKKTISSQCIVQYELSNEIKLKYSLIKPLKLNDDDNFSNIYYAKTNYFIYFDNWCKMISKNNYNISTYKGLRENMKKFGINFALVFFSIFSIQNPNIIDILKIGILTKLLKWVFNNEDNINIMSSINNYNEEKKSNIFIINNFNFLKNNDCFFNNRKEKLYYLIKSILYPNEILPISKDYYTFLYQQLTFIMNIKFLKWKLLDEYFFTDFFSQKNKSILNYFSPKNFLYDIILIARKKPFLFLSTLEEQLNFNIEPFIKFKSSISLESLSEKLLLDNIIIDLPKNHSYIKPDEISGFILAKNIFISDSFNNDNTDIDKKINIPKNKIYTNLNFVPKPNVMEAKINMKEYGEVETNVSKNSYVNNGENLNNITNVKKALGQTNYNDNNEYENNNHSIYTFSPRFNSRIYWKDIANEFTISLPSICYKQIYKFEEIPNITQKTLFKYLKSKYTILRFEPIKDWYQNISEIFFQIHSINFNIERAILKCMFYIFINYYYFDNNINEAKKTLLDIKDICSKENFQLNYQELSIINLIEGLLKENYFLSEKYFSISIMFTLLMYGEPRGRNNESHGFMMFPLWKVARKASFLEDSFINENFKEMFHALEYNEIYKNSKKYIHEKHVYNYQDKIRKNIETYLQNNCKKLNTLNSQINESMDNIDERSFFENFLLNTEKNIQLSESNFLYENTEVNSIKNFLFPQISKKTKSLNAYFLSREYIIYFLKQLQSFFNDKSKPYSKYFINLISNEIFNPSIHNQSPKTQFSEHSITLTKNKKKKFSNFFYEQLLDKLSYKKNVPNGVLISFGNNMHHETTHDNIDSLTLPRIVFKLKNITIEKIYSGWEHSLIIDSKNEIYSWGNNQSCQCGINKSLYQIVQNPINISYLNNGIKAKEISCGNEYNLILTTNNELYGFGSNDDCVLCLKDKKIKTEQFTKIPLNIENDKIIQISSGTVHNLILTEKGKVYSWGSSQGGQLGLSENILTSFPNFINELCINQPIQIPILSNIKKIVSGEAHSIALSKDGKCYSWGFGSNGQLGLGFCEDSFEPGYGMSKSRVFEPKLIENFDNIKDISSGKTFSMFINEKNELFGCGINDLFQCGIQEKNPKNHIFNPEIECFDFIIPTMLKCFFNMKVEKVSCGEGHCIAIVKDNSDGKKKVWCWGNNKFGQLGIGGQIKKSLPKTIDYLLQYDDVKIEDISCGGFHSLCLIKYKKSVEWIENDYKNIIVKAIKENNIE